MELEPPISKSTPEGEEHKVIIFPIKPPSLETVGKQIITLKDGVKITNEELALIREFLPNAIIHPRIVKDFEDK